MLDFMYQSSWGAFTIMLFFHVPFLLVFFYILYRKTAVDPGPSGTDDGRISRAEGLWITLVIVLFVGINVVSIKYMPTVSTAHAASAENIQNIDVTAQSWSYEISERQLEVGRPVRFSVKSADTVHGFGVYHPHVHRAGQVQGPVSGILRHRAPRDGRRIDRQRQSISKRVPKRISLC